MTVRFIIPGPLRDYTSGEGEVTIEGNATSIADALSLLWGKHPALRDRIVTEQNVVRPHVNVFVDGESIRFSGGLRTSVSDGSEIVILPAVSGG